MSTPDPAAGDWCQCGNPNRGGAHAAYRCGYDYRQTYAYATPGDTAAVGDVETLAEVIRSGYWAAVQHGAASLYDEQARAVLASDWLRDLLDIARREGGAEALREAADCLPALTEGVDRAGTETWRAHDRDVYSLAIEESQAALRDRAARYGGAR
jgi:hypothetical protein